MPARKRHHRPSFRSKTAKEANKTRCDKRKRAHEDDPVPQRKRKKQVQRLLDLDSLPSASRKRSLTPISRAPEIDLESLPSASRKRSLTPIARAPIRLDTRVTFDEESSGGKLFVHFMQYVDKSHETKEVDLFRILLKKVATF